MTNPVIDPRINNLAIICPSWVGDAIMATPAYRVLRKNCPYAHITAFMRPGLDDLLNGHPDLDTCVPLSMNGIAGPWNAAAAIRKHKPDAVVLLPNSFRSALTARLTRAKRRIGYDRDGRRFLLTHAIETPKSPTPTSTVDFYIELVRKACDLELKPDATLTLAVTDDERRDAQPILQELGEQFVVLNPGGNRDSKRWPAEHFAQLADHIHNQYKCNVAVTGSPGEKDLLENITSAASSNVLNLATLGVTLRTLKPIIKDAALLVTNDTGPRHIAAALGTPVITLFGPTDHRWTTLADAKEHIILAEPFLPEELVADDHEKACAIDRIPVTDVLFAARQTLGN